MSVTYESIVLFGVLVFFGYAFSAVLGYTVDPRQPSAVDWAFRAWLFVVLGAYFVWFWSDGRRTLPMRTIGVRLVDDAGRPLGRGRAVRRYLWAWLLIAIPIAGAGWLHPACLLLLPLPYFSALLDPQRRTLYDRLAGTRLIVDTRPVA